MAQGENVMLKCGRHQWGYGDIKILWTDNSYVVGGRWVRITKGLSLRGINFDDSCLVSLFNGCLVTQTLSLELNG